MFYLRIFVFSYLHVYNVVNVAGYDGAMFGDVSFIGDQYDKLPVK